VTSVARLVHTLSVSSKTSIDYIWSFPGKHS